MERSCKMNIMEVKKLRDELEKDILDSIVTFEKVTQCSVRSISIIKATGVVLEYTVAVKSEVIVPIGKF